MAINRTLYIFEFLVKFSDVYYFCMKCKYHISKILLRIATKSANYPPNSTHYKKYGICPENPTACLQTYWAPRAQMPQQFPALTTSTKTHNTNKIKTIITNTIKTISTNTINTNNNNTSDTDTNTSKARKVSNTSNKTNTSKNPTQATTPTTRTPLP